MGIRVDSHGGISGSIGCLPLVVFIVFVVLIVGWLIGQVL